MDGIEQQNTHVSGGVGITAGRDIDATGAHIVGGDDNSRVMIKKRGQTSAVAMAVAVLLSPFSWAARTWQIHPFIASGVAVAVVGAAGGITYGAVGDHQKSPLSVARAAAGNDQSAPPVSTSVLSPSTVDPVSTSSASSSAVTTPSPTYSPGEISLTGDQINSLVQCGSSGVPIGSSAILAGGLMSFGCFGTGSTHVVLDVTNGGKRLWSRDLPSDTKWFSVGQHVYLITPHTTPATALASAQIHYTLDCLDPRTGVSLWSSPLNDWLSSDQRGELQNYPSDIEEGSDPADGHSHIVVVTWDSSTLFDTDTGADLSHGPEQGDYGPLAYGVTRNITNTDASVSSSGVMTATGTSTITGKHLWTVTEPTWQPDRGTYDDGPVEVKLSSSEIFAYDVRTGKTVAKGRVQAGLGTPVFQNGEVLAPTEDGKHLELFRITDMERPLWTIDADQATAVAIRNGVVVAQGPRGLILLSPKDGSVLGEVQRDELPGRLYGPVPAYGLAFLQSGSVIQLGVDLQSP